MQTAYRNWDSQRRLEETSSDGLAAEVLFPNTVPPFFPSGNLTAAPPRAGEHELRWEGLKAHNRWLADFCNDAPGRRAGMAQILLHDVDAAVAEIRWARTPACSAASCCRASRPTAACPPSSPPSTSRSGRRAKSSTCRSTTTPRTPRPDYGPYDATMAMWLIEAGFFSHRALWMLIFAGVFERHPNLKLILTEGGSDWVPGVMKVLDHQYDKFLDTNKNESRHRRRARAPQHVDEAKRVLRPQRLDRLELHHAARELHALRSRRRPHHVGQRTTRTARRTYPYTREALRYTFEDTDPIEVAAMLGGNAAKVYDFDLDLLRKVAVEIEAPTVAEVLVPLAPGDVPTESELKAFEDGPVRVW